MDLSVVRCSTSFDVFVVQAQEDSRSDVSGEIGEVDQWNDGHDPAI